MREARKLLDVVFKYLTYVNSCQRHPRQLEQKDRLHLALRAHSIV